MESKKMSVRRTAPIEKLLSKVGELRPELKDSLSTVVLLALGALVRELEATDLLSPGASIGAEAPKANFLESDVNPDDQWD